MRRALKIVAAGLVSLAVLAAVGAVAWRMLHPDPAQILAGLDVPTAPSLSAEDELATFRTAPGFRVELVAAEPLVVDPVAMDWDDDGRLYVAEMRGFMPDIDGTNEDRAIGRVVVLEDTDGDGRMDRSDVFLDGLVLPRAIAVLPEGVLIGARPDLWLCRDTTGDRACNERTRLGDYAIAGSNPEHQENGLLSGLDGWIYNAKSPRRFRLSDGGRSIEADDAPLRGQWGIAQDDAGRLFYNHNSAFLYGDAIPDRYAMRQSATAASLAKPGLRVALSENAEVFGIRLAAGLNRAYLPGTLRRDGRQRAPTAASGLVIQRGDQYGPDYVGDAFVPEAGGSVVAHFAIERDGLELRAEHRTYDDAQWGSREFLASSDERFRPVDAHFGPDGAVWLIDMYRGVIQHAHFVSDHLRRYVERHRLAPPGATGRIWRIVREDAAIERRPPPLETLAQQLDGLDHANGWVRDHAQRRIAYERAPGAADALRRLEDFGPLGRRHALWALDRMGEIDSASVARALADSDPEIRKIGLRVAEALLARSETDVLAAVTALLDDTDAAVQIQALHTLGSLPHEVRPVEVLLSAGRSDGPDEWIRAIERQAAISGLAGLELAMLQSEFERAGATKPNESTRQWLAELAAATHFAACQDTATPGAQRVVIDLVDDLEVDWHKVTALAGIEQAQRIPGSRRIELAAAHPLFDAERGESNEVTTAIARVRPHFTWPGDPRPGGARALTPSEQQRRERGRELFANGCAACHGVQGRGLAGLAPSLVGSPWVRDADDWLVRIALQGMRGPIRIDGEPWDANMPGHGRDPRFDDEGMAGVLTHLRRSWGHAEDPVDPATVARIRAKTAERTLPWTAAELLELPVEHRYDRYAGIYRVPIVGMELEVRRTPSGLSLGMPGGPAGEIEEIGSGLFMSDEMTIQFEAGESGRIEGARASRDGLEFPLSKEE